jgi:acyl carrier protein
MNDHLDDVVRRAVARHLGVETAVIDPFHHLERDLHLQPLDIVLIVLAIEDAEKIELPVAQLGSVTTVAGLTAMLRRVSASIRYAYRPTFVPIYRRLRRARRPSRRQQEM